MDMDEPKKVPKRKKKKLTFTRRVLLLTWALKHLQIPLQMDGCDAKRKVLNCHFALLLE